MKRPVLFSERAVFIAILANCIILILHSFRFGGFWDSIIVNIDHLLTLYLIAEVVFLMIANGASNYLVDPWHKFDFAITILAIPSLLLIGFESEHLSSEVFLSLRLLRVFKFLRFIEFIPNAKDLTENLVFALRSSMYVFSAFFVYLLILSIMSAYLFADVAPKYFSNALESFFSVFAIFSGAWPEIATEINANSSPTYSGMARLFFVFMAFSGGIIGTSIITTILIDSSNDRRSSNAPLNQELEALRDSLRELREEITQLRTKQDK